MDFHKTSGGTKQYLGKKGGSLAPLDPPPPPQIHHCVPLTHPICRPIPGQVGQSYGILPVSPKHSILFTILSNLSHVSGTVLWDPTCPTNTSYMSILSHLSHVGQVGQMESHLSHQQLNPMCSSYPFCSMHRTSGTVLRNPTCPTNTLIIQSVCPIPLVPYVIQ